MTLLNKLKQASLFATALIAGISLAGCGAKGSVGVPDPPPHPLASTTRMLQVGDRWTYRYVSPYSDAEDGRAIKVTQTVESRNASGEIGYRSVSSERHVQYVSELSLRQDTGDAALYLLGQHRSGTLYWYDADGAYQGSEPFEEGATVYPANYPFLFGSWQSGATAGYVKPIVEAPISASPGEPGSHVPDRNFRIIGTETIAVPAGRFETWKVRFKEDGYESTVWYAPQIGNLVKRLGTAPSYGFPPHRNARMSVAPPYKYEIVLVETTVAP